MIGRHKPTVTIRPSETVKLGRDSELNEVSMLWKARWIMIIGYEESNSSAN
jgi:hypothetical protein